MSGKESVPLKQVRNFPAPPTGFTALAAADKRSTLPNPDSLVAHATAMRTVMLYRLVEAFDLRPEESMWAGYHLDKVCEPLMTLRPSNVPMAVRQEMLDGSYSKLLELRERVSMARSQTTYDHSITHASAEEWAEALIEPVFHSYDLRPILESQILGQIVGMLRELGVDDKNDPRGATFLPKELRTLND